MDLVIWMEAGVELSSTRRRPTDMVPRLVMVLLSSAAVLAGCASRSVRDEERLIEVHGDRAYLCLSNAVNDSRPPSCAADIGTSDNPELIGRMVSELVQVLAGRSQNVEVTAEEQDGKWFLQGFRAPS